VIVRRGGAALITGDSVFVSNRAPAGSNVANQGNATVYLLPTPPGTYLPNEYTCGSSCVGVPHAQQLANLALIEDVDLPYICPRGYWCDGVARHPCPPGKRGDGTGFSNSQCGGDCPAGRYCPENSKAPLICPDGTFSEKGSGQSSCPECLPGKWCAGGEQYDCPAATEGMGRIASSRARRAHSTPQHSQQAHLIPPSASASLTSSMTSAASHTTRGRAVLISR